MEYIPAKWIHNYTLDLLCSKIKILFVSIWTAFSSYQSISNNPLFYYYIFFLKPFSLILKYYNYYCTGYNIFRFNDLNNFFIILMRINKIYLSCARHKCIIRIHFVDNTFFFTLSKILETIQSYLLISLLY